MYKHSSENTYTKLADWESELFMIGRTIWKCENVSCRDHNIIFSQTLNKMWKKVQKVVNGTTKMAKWIEYRFKCNVKYINKRENNTNAVDTMLYNNMYLYKVTCC